MIEPDDFRKRIFYRPLWSWKRLWFYQPPYGPRLPPVTLVKLLSGTRVMAVSYADCPEVVGGETLSNPDLLSGSLGDLTISGLSVLEADFDGIPAGQGVKFTVEGGQVGQTYNFAVRVKLAMAGRPIISCRLAVVADHD